MVVEVVAGEPALDTRGCRPFWLETEMLADDVAFAGLYAGDWSDVVWGGDLPAAEGLANTAAAVDPLRGFTNEDSGELKLSFCWYPPDGVWCC